MKTNNHGANKKRSILIVDDDRAFLDTLASVLEVDGYEVVSVPSGERAIAEAKRREFDCLLIDIKMPVLNGVDTWRELKKIIPDAKPIFMTAYSQSQLVASAREEGALAVFSKPLDMEKLIAVLNDSPNRSILIVDDDKAFRETLKAFMESKSYAVSTASSAEEAISLFEEHPSQSVILDMKLDAGPNGLDVLVVIKGINPAVLVILMTGYREEMAPLVEKAISISAYACLYKPFEPEDLIRILEELPKGKKGGG